MSIEPEASDRGLSSELRARCETFARPLYTGLDGVQEFDRVEKVMRLVGSLQVDEEGPLDRELLELLALFHGIVGRLGSLGAGGRFDLFLRGLALDADKRRRVRRGLERFAANPRGVEECMLHDAVLLRDAGVPAAVGRLLEAGRKRTTARRAVERLDPGPAVERFKTASGSRLAAAARRRTEAWLSELRELLDDSDRPVS